MKIGIYLEYDGKKLTASSGELLAVAQGLTAAENIVAFVNAAPQAELNTLAAGRVIAVENAVFGSDMAAVVCEQKDSWDWFLFPMTLNGRELGAYLKMLVGCELVFGVSDIKVQENSAEITKLVAGGLTQEHKTCSDADKIALGIVPGVWSDRAAPVGNAVVERLRIEAADNAELQKEYLAPWTEIAVSEAKVVVAGGSGMATAENFNKLYGLGESLAAPVGGSRVAEDKGWIQHKAMIGATGSTIAPKLYIACGISGAVQHLVGVQGAELTISVNTDAMCGMMQNADLAVVCDCNELIPKLVEELKKYKRTEAI